MRDAVRWLLLPAAFLIVTAAFADNGPAPKSASPEAWLTRIYTALHTLNYEGTFVYIHGDQISSMQVTHRGDSAGGIERLESLTGPPHEVIRNHTDVESVLPESRRVLVERRGADLHFPANLVGHVDATQLAAHYDLKNLGKDRIAGVHCQVISVLPKDQYRYGYKLWLDAGTGMLLRSDLVTRDGKLVARVMFTSLRYPQSIPDSALRATEIRPGFVWNVQGNSEKPTPDETGWRWKVGRLPPGFTLASQNVQRVAGTRQPVRHMVFSDGLATVSVFTETAVHNDHALIGPSTMGPVNAFGRELEDRHITVIGEVPAPTVKLIADSMQLVRRPQP